MNTGHLDTPHLLSNQQATQRREIVDLIKSFSDTEREMVIIEIGSAFNLQSRAVNNLLTGGNAPKGLDVSRVISWLNGYKACLDNCS